MTLIAVMDPHVRAGKWRLQGGFRCANRGPGAVSIATIAAITTGSGLLTGQAMTTSPMPWPGRW